MNIPANIIGICLIIISSTATAQIQLQTLKELNDSMQKDPRPVLFFLSAEWCSYCHLQKKELKAFFESPAKPFYYLEFDIENKQPACFNHRYFSYKPNGVQTGIHEFAVFLSGTREGVQCPAWILIDAGYNFIFRHAGMLFSRDLKEIITQLKPIEKQQ